MAELKDGSSTSEHKITWIAIVTSIVLPAVYAIVDGLLSSGVVHNALAVAMLSVVSTTLAALGYTASRTALKKQAKAAETAVELSRRPTPPPPEP